MHWQRRVFWLELGLFAKSCDPCSYSCGTAPDLTGFPLRAPGVRALGHLCRSSMRLWREYSTRGMGCQIRDAAHGPGATQMRPADSCSFGLCGKLASVHNGGYRSNDDVTSPPHLRGGPGRRLAPADRPAHVRGRWCGRTLSSDVSVSPETTAAAGVCQRRFCVARVEACLPSQHGLRRRHKS